MSHPGTIGLGASRGPECWGRGGVLFSLGLTRSEAVLMWKLRQEEEDNEVQVTQNGQVGGGNRVDTGVDGRGLRQGPHTEGAGQGSDTPYALPSSAVLPTWPPSMASRATSHSTHQTCCSSISECLPLPPSIWPAG